MIPPLELACFGFPYPSCAFRFTSESLTKRKRQLHALAIQPTCLLYRCLHPPHKYLHSHSRTRANKKF